MAWHAVQDQTRVERVSHYSTPQETATRRTERNEKEGVREGGSWASFEEAVLPPSIERQEKRRERLLRVTELKRKSERERARACGVKMCRVGLATPRATGNRGSMLFFPTSFFLARRE